MVIAALTCYKPLSITHLEIYPNQSSPTDFAEEPEISCLGSFEPNPCGCEGSQESKTQKNEYGVVLLC